MVNLRSRIVLPLTVVVVLVLLATIGVLRLQAEHVIVDYVAGHGRYIQRLYQAKLTEHSEKMVAILVTLERNEALKQALNEGNRSLLSELSLRLFEELKSRNLISSLAYADSQRANLLRVENPGVLAETMNEVAALEAEHSGNIARGLEMGRHGQLNYWVVAPWYEKNFLLGFVELGANINQILFRLSRLLEPALFVALNKDFLHREDWQQQQAVIGVDASWERYPKHVLFPVESANFSSEVWHFIGESLGKPSGDSIPQLSSGGMNYCLIKFPLFDANMNSVAEIVALVDVSKVVNQSDRVSTIVIGAVTIVGLGVLAVFFMLSDATQKQLLASHQQLVQAKDELKERFNQRTRELRRSETDYRQLVENANSIILRWDPNGFVTFINKFAQKFFGYSDKEIVGRNVLGTIIPDREPVNLRNLHKMIRELAQYPVGFGDNEFENIKRDGTLVWISWTNRVIKDDQGKVIEILSIGQDISTKKNTENELKLAASVFENIVEGVMIINSKGEILRTNRAYTSITGYVQEEVIGKTPEAFFVAEYHGPGFHQQIWQKLGEEGLWQGEVWCKRQSDEIYPQWLSISAIQNGDEDSSRYVCVFVDITERKHNEEQINRLAHFDSLTNLPNRILFQDRLNHALAEAKRNKLCVPLLFLDLDRFKVVNDSLGHDAGDLLLQRVAKRLGECLRESDTLSRMGGDEFTIILGALDSLDELIVSVTQVAHKILTEFSKPFDLEGNEVVVSISIGVAAYPEDGQTLSDLLRKADMAMYHAKQESQGFFIYQPE